MTSPNDSDLRRLLDDAVSDVHPEGGPEQIRARGRRPSAARWVPLTLAAAVATILVIGGGAWLAQQQPSNDSPAAGPGPTEAPASQAPAEQSRTVDTTVYYVGDTASGARLFPEQHRVEDATETDLQVAVEEALAGEPQDPDYRPGFPNEDATVKASTDGATITIDFSREPGALVNMTDEGAELALQALVWTAQAATNSDAPVRFTIDGQPVDRVYGVDTANPVQRTSEDSVVSPVLIDSPAQGAKVPTQFEVTGRAATFEANVVWELKRGDATVRNGFTTAQECCTLSPYSFTVTAPPGDYTLVVHDTDESDGEGCRHQPGHEGHHGRVVVRQLNHRWLSLSKPSILSAPGAARSSARSSGSSGRPASRSR